MGCPCFVNADGGLEPIQLQLSGGQLQPDQFQTNRTARELKFWRCAAEKGKRPGRTLRFGRFVSSCLKVSGMQFRCLDIALKKGCAD